MLDRDIYQHWYKDGDCEDNGGNETKDIVWKIFYFDNFSCLSKDLQPHNIFNPLFQIIKLIFLI